VWQLEDHHLGGVRGAEDVAPAGQVGLSAHQLSGPPPVVHVPKDKA
jgi:hypothetical protein